MADVDRLGVEELFVPLRPARHPKTARRCWPQNRIEGSSRLPSSPIWPARKLVRHAVGHAEVLGRTSERAPRLVGVVAAGDHLVPRRRTGSRTTAWKDLSRSDPQSVVVSS